MELDLSGDKELCHSCDKVTLWRKGRGDFLVCEVCGDRFPCKSKRCGHEDCKLARKEIAGVDQK